MLRVLEFLACFYWIHPLITVAQSLRYSDWSRARQRGTLGILIEFVRGVLLLNATQFYVPNTGNWDMGTVNGILRKRGVPTFGTVYARGEFAFFVPSRRAWLAANELLKAGVPFSYAPRR